MSEQLNSADAITLTGGLVKAFGALNLDKRWGALAVGVGQVADGVDGEYARANGIDSPEGAILDNGVDRVTEGILVASLVENDVVSIALPIIGYGVKQALKLTGKSGTTNGETAALLKDVAIVLGTASTMFSKESKTNRILKVSANTIGWCAIGIGLNELLEN